MTTSNAVLTMLLLAAMGASPSWAENGQDGDGPDLNGDEMDGKGPLILQQVQVVGEVLNLPGAGGVVDRDALRRHGYDDINRALRNVPGVYVREEDGFGMFPNISIRGVDHGRSSKVTIMEDGIMQEPAPYSAPAAYYSPTTARMSAVEVLKGTSQVRHGPHTTGGVVNYRSTPIPGQREGYARVGSGSFNELRAHVYHGDTRRTDHGNVGYLVEAFERRNDGFKRISDSPAEDGVQLYDNEARNTGMSTSDYVTKLMWEPDTERYQRWEFMAGTTELNNNESYQGITDADFAEDPCQRYAPTRFDDVFTEQDRFSLRHAWDVSNAFDLNTVAYYTRFNRSWNRIRGVVEDEDGNVVETLADAESACADGGCGTVRHAEALVDADNVGILRGEAPGVFSYRFNNRDYYTAGFQSELDGFFTTSNWAHDWSLGFRYHEDEIDRDQRQDAFEQDANGFITGQVTGNFGETNPATGIFPGDRVQEAQAYSLFAENAMSRGAWTITPGARFEEIDVGWTDRASGDSFRGDLSVFAGSLSATYRTSPQTIYYGGVHQGYSVPDPRGIINDGVTEETSISFELGQRFTSADGAFSSDIGLFHTDFDDLVETPNLGAGGAADLETQSIGDVTTTGLEAALAYDVGVARDAAWSMPLTLVATYTDARIDGDVAASSPGSIFSGARDGNDVPYVPDLQLKAGVGLETGPYSLALDVIYQDEMYGTADNVREPTETTLPEGSFGPDARQGVIDRYWIADLSGSYDLTPTSSVFVNIHNVTDEQYMVSRLPQGPRPGKPRSIMAGVEISF